MIRSADVNSEISTIDKETKTAKGDGLVRLLIKAVTLLLKVLRDIRTNQVNIMKKQGIELIKEDRKSNEKTKK